MFGNGVIRHSMDLEYRESVLLDVSLISKDYVRTQAMNGRPLFK